MKPESECICMLAARPEKEWRAKLRATIPSVCFLRRAPKTQPELSAGTLGAGEKKRADERKRWPRFIVSRCLPCHPRLRDVTTRQASGARRRKTSAGESQTNSDGRTRRVSFGGASSLDADQSRLDWRHATSPSRCSCFLLRAADAHLIARVSKLKR